MVLRRLRGPLTVAAVAAVFLAYVSWMDPNETGHYPTCPFFALTGLWCPGCGSTRALHALTHGDLGAAAGFNVLAVSVVPILIWWWVRWARRAVAGRERVITTSPRWGWALLAVLAVFAVLRNTPWGTALAP